MQAATALPFFPQRIAIEIKVGPKPRSYRERDGVGFRRGDVGTHTSRTIMLAELTALFDAVPAAASEADITIAIRHANCLSKSTTSTRRLTHQRLTELYALDPHVPIYRVLRRLWSLEPTGRPLLALLVAIARDPMLAASAPAVVLLPIGADFARGPMKDAIRAAMLEGARAVGGDVREIGDRREAIAAAVAEAGPGDVLLILGKGHEPGQEIAGIVHPFDDRDEVRRALLGGSGSAP